MATLMIHGANGYTGTLISEQACRIGLEIVLAGRTERSLQSMAAALDTEYRVFDLNSVGLIDSNLSGIKVLLNCAGPFAQTAQPLQDACIRNGVQYLDVSAELVSYELAESNDLEAQNENVILLPGSGGSVASLGCLASTAFDMVGGAQHVDAMYLALRISGSMSHGSAASAKKGHESGLLQRRNGRLEPQEVDCNTQFDFENGLGVVSCFPVTLPDLITIHRFFGVDNLRTFAHATGTAFSVENETLQFAGPAVEERSANPYDAAVRVFTKDGNLKNVVLHSINGYTFTAIASVEAARRILQHEYLPGFQTPASLFGKNFAATIIEYFKRG